MGRSWVIFWAGSGAGFAGRCICPVEPGQDLAMLHSSFVAEQK